MTNMAIETGSRIVALETFKAGSIGIPFGDHFRARPVSQSGNNTVNAATMPIPALRQMFSLMGLAGVAR